jgi:hypothetical protein
VAWLQPYAKAHGPVIPVAERSGHASDKRLETLLNEARIKAGIATWPNNCLRHSYGSYMTVKKNDEGYVCEEMGNSIQMVREHYKQAIAPAAAEAYFNIYPYQAIEELEVIEIAQRKIGNL